MVFWQNGTVVPVAIADVLAHSPFLVDPHSSLIQTARALGTYIGSL
jgi:6-phosphofructokinase 1